MTAAFFGPCSRLLGRAPDSRFFADAAQAKMEMDEKRENNVCPRVCTSTSGSFPVFRASPGSLSSLRCEFITFPVRIGPSNPRLSSTLGTGLTTWCPLRPRDPVEVPLCLCGLARGRKPDAICGTHQPLTHTRSHRPPFLPAHAIFSSLRHPSDADEPRRSVLGGDPPPHGPCPSPLVVCTHTRSTHPLLHLPFHQTQLSCRHRCPRSYTLGAGADGSYSGPSITAPAGGGAPPITHIHVQYIQVLVRTCVLRGDTDNDKRCIWQQMREGIQ